MSATHALGEPVLSTDAVSVHRDDRTVLDAVSFELRAGEVLSLIGPNGAGKSTLLGVVAGSVAADSGRVVLDGRPVGQLSPLEQARRRGVLPQEHTVGFSFCCREVVHMGRHPWNGTNANADDEVAVEEAMRVCAVEQFARRRFSSLSGGERARVALARVIAQRTPILMLDEPTAAMDLRYQELVMSLVRRHADAGGAALVVVHDLGLAAAYSDRVLLLDGGAVRAVGAVADTLNADLLGEVYGLPIAVHRHRGQLMIGPDRFTGAG